ncbi:DUF2171 domain-containing protein [Sphingosinicella sp. CPCC 101087]|uniref:DUF2171 domain-containing protein n=1 Tax=Sphingosinicella sp. CPCC 101087 TaxID=2497754 RepID=UPI001FB11E7D|nr:DUF2171 domain-containing protein [Sphingosinicella sp. CPCC 101087]
MAYDDRHDRGRGHDRERGREWRGEGRPRRDWEPRPQRLGDRGWRGERDDPEYGMERYGPGRAEGFGGEDYAPSSDPDSYFAAPGYDPEFGGPRFDRLDVGSTGTHGVHPVSSMYGADYRGAAGVAPGGTFNSSARRYAEIGRSGRHDPHYAEWRNRQIEQLDRDYDEYRRENQSRFDREFMAWRDRRGQQRQALGRVTEHMEVVGSDGSHVGTVDRTHGDSIVLTKSDPNAGGHHHSIPCGWVETVDDKVRLNLSAEEAMERWRDEDRSRALFERPSGVRGPHVLNRSFSGTYRDDE